MTASVDATIFAMLSAAFPAGADKASAEAAGPDVESASFSLLYNGELQKAGVREARNRAAGPQGSGTGQANPSNAESSSRDYAVSGTTGDMGQGERPHPAVLSGRERDPSVPVLREGTLKEAAGKAGRQFPGAGPHGEATLIVSPDGQKKPVSRESGLSTEHGHRPVLIGLAAAGHLWAKAMGGEGRGQAAPATSELSHPAGIAAIDAMKAGGPGQGLPSAQGGNPAPLEGLPNLRDLLQATLTMRNGQVPSSAGKTGETALLSRPGGPEQGTPSLVRPTPDGLVGKHGFKKSTESTESKRDSRGPAAGVPRLSAGSSAIGGQGELPRNQGAPNPSVILREVFARTSEGVNPAGTREGATSSLLAGQNASDDGDGRSRMNLSGREAQVRHTVSGANTPRFSEGAFLKEGRPGEVDFDAARRASARPVNADAPLRGDSSRGEQVLRGESSRPVAPFQGALSPEAEQVRHIVGEGRTSRDIRREGMERVDLPPRPDMEGRKAGQEKAQAGPNPAARVTAEAGQRFRDALPSEKQAERTFEATVRNADEGSPARHLPGRQLSETASRNRDDRGLSQANAAARTEQSPGMTESARSSAVMRFPLETRVFAEHLSSVASSLGRGGSQRVRIHLTPPHLGSLDMEVIIRDRPVRVLFRVDSVEAGRFLQAGTEQLKASLQGQGLNVESFSVTQRDQQWSSLFQQGNGQDGFQENDGKAEKEESRGGASEDRDSQGTAPGADNGDDPARINYFA